MTRLATATAAALLALGLAAPASAQASCPVAGDPWDLDAEAVDALYDCMSAVLATCYARGGDPVGAAYRGWTVTATRPAVTGPHGERFLMTWANDVAAAQYLRYEEGAFEMPVGSILAKESFGVSGGMAMVGPLFVMTKVADAPETDGWRYSGVQEDGASMGVSQSFCHDCHGGFEASDSMGYPGAAVRIAAQ